MHFDSYSVEYFCKQRRNSILYSISTYHIPKSSFFCHQQTNRTILNLSEKVPNKLTTLLLFNEKFCNWNLI